MHNSSLIGTTIAAYSGGDKPDYTQAQIRVLHNNSIANTLWSFLTYKFLICVLFFSVALRPNAGHGLLILEVSRSHTTTHHSR